MPELTPLEKQWKQEPTMWISIGFTSLMVALALVYIYGMHKKLPSFLSPNQPGKCAVLPARYCDKEKPVTYPNNQTYLGFNLPKDTYIYAPFSGMFVATGTAESDPKLNTNGEVVILPFGDNGGEAFHFMAEFKPLIPTRTNVKAGQAIGVTDGNVIDQVSDSNLLLEFYGVSTQGQPYANQGLLTKYFSVK